MGNFVGSRRRVGFMIAPLAVAAFGLSACTGNVGDPSVPSSTPTVNLGEESVDSADWLFTVSGELETNRYEGKKYLTLREPTKVLAFTAHPIRVSTDIDSSTLVALWQQLGFASDPPNSAIAQAKKTPVSAVLADPAAVADGSIRWRIPADSDLPSGKATITIDGGTNQLVNVQVTDRINQTNVKVIGNQAAESLSTLQSQTSEALQQAAKASLPETASPNSESTFEEIYHVDTNTLTQPASKMLTITNGQGVPGAKTPTQPSLP